MSSILDELACQSVWLAYLEHKVQHAHLTRRTEAELREFIERRAWEPVTHRLSVSAGNLGIPRKRLVNKLGKANKRVVYSFAPEEQQVLKVLAWLLYRYDHAQPSRCYSFRRGFGAHRAIRELTNLPNIDSLFCCKMDVQDYFNSIRIEKLLPILAEVMCDDEQLFCFFSEMLSKDQAYFGEELIVEKRGVMAGTPTAPFLANLYLRELDNEMTGRASAYARYSDDIIIFAESARQLNELRQRTEELLQSHGLRSNPAKEQCTSPGEAWEFLGISYQQGTLDLSTATQRKLKGKIRRKARALRRWMLRKDADEERATAAMIRSMNRKFYERGSAHELTWSRWFFPLITTSRSLANLDAYLQQELRTIATGRHGKTNYKLRYAHLKKLGYRSLVHEYYQYRKRQTL